MPPRKRKLEDTSGEETPSGDTTSNAPQEYQRSTRRSAAAVQSHNSGTGHPPKTAHRPQRETTKPPARKAATKSSKAGTAKKVIGHQRFDEDDEEEEGMDLGEDSDEIDEEEEEESDGDEGEQDHDDDDAEVQSNIKSRPAALDEEDSEDDDAPEEISMSAAKQASINVRKAETESKKALAAKKKELNRKKEESIKKVREAAEVRKKNQEEFLDPAVLEAVAKQKEMAAPTGKAEKRQNRVIKFREESKFSIERQGFTLKKLGSEHRERASVAQDATNLLARHFGNVRRKEYSSVHCRRLGPSRNFGVPA